MTRMPLAARLPYRRRFAQYYDAIYHGMVNYEGDVDFLETVFRKFHRKPKTILDLGCGTGNHDFPLARRGYEVTGIDQSQEMLSSARKKAKQARWRPRFVRASMQTFRLPQTFDAAICMFGAFDYLINLRDVFRCLRNVCSHLTPRGLFVFEYWQTSGVRPGIQSWLDLVSSEREIVRLSESQFDSRRSQLTMDFRFMVLRGREVVDRFSERHVVRTYTRQEMSTLLGRAGLDRLGEFAVTPQRKEFRRVTPREFRIMAVARLR